MFARILSLVLLQTMLLTGCITTGTNGQSSSDIATTNKSVKPSSSKSFFSSPTDSGIPKHERIAGEAALRPAKALLAKHDKDGAVKALATVIVDESVPSYYRAQAASMQGKIFLSRQRNLNAAMSYEKAAELYDTVSYPGVFSKQLRNEAVMAAVPSFIRSGRAARGEWLMQKYGLTNFMADEMAWEEYGINVRHKASGILFPKSVGSFKLDRKRVNADDPNIFDVTYRGYNGNYTLFHYNDRNLPLEDEAWNSFKVMQKIFPVTGFALKKTIEPGDFNGIDMDGYVIEDVMQGTASGPRFAAGIVVFKKGRKVYKIRYVLNETQISAKLSDRPSADMPGFEAIEILTYRIDLANSRFLR